MDKNVELVYKALVDLGARATTTELIAKQNEMLLPLANDLGVITTQKVSAYLNKLYAQKRIEKVVEKKKTYFFIAE